MDNLTTYENDKDFNLLISNDITADKLLEFMFKKKGKVNVTNFAYLAAKRKIDTTNLFLQLASEGKIKLIGSHAARITLKARWEKFRDSDNMKWAIAAIGILLAFLALR